jgi:hypothetical protein
VSDSDFAKKEYQKILKEAAQYAKLDIETKKAFVLRLKEKATIMFKAEERDLHELSSYMWNELSKYDFTYHKGEFYELFSENEKRNYSESSVPNFEHVCEFSENLGKGISKCNCGRIEMEGIEYDVAIQEPEINEESEFSKDSKDYKKSQDKQKKDPYQNKTTEYLQRIEFNCDNLKDFCKDLVDKYYADEATAKIIDETIKDIDKALEGQKYLEAKIIHLSKLTDFRNKIGEFEKLKAILLEKTTFNLAKVAKMLRITPKHLSKNIIRNMDQYMANLKWFRSLVFTAGKDYKKGDQIAVDLTDWYQQQLENKVLGLEMINPN